MSQKNNDSEMQQQLQQNQGYGLGTNADKLEQNNSKQFQNQINQQYPQEPCEPPSAEQIYDQQPPYEPEPEYYPDPEPNQYDDLEIPIAPSRSKSLNNSQYQLRELTFRIMQEVETIRDLTNLSEDWAILYYNACGWRRDVCRDMWIQGNQKARKLMKWDGKYGHADKKGVEMGNEAECGCCGETGKIVSNMCGHGFCFQCWKGHFLYRLATQWRDPFPPCMTNECPIKMVYSLCKVLCDSDPKIKQKFTQVLCRSYSTYNRSVKICKGRPGVSCNQCFTIEKMLQSIECNTCGNIVCPRCGQQFHGSCQCYLLSNWKKLTEDSTEFIQLLGYKICPFCKEVVERKQGCNSMICKCGNQFCYVCGQKWIPNHKAHGDSTCPKFKQIQLLKAEKQKQTENKHKYAQLIQERVAKLDSFLNCFNRIQKFKKETIPNVTQTFLVHLPIYRSSFENPLLQFCHQLLKVYCVLWGETISQHFYKNKGKQQFAKLIEQKADEIYYFLLGNPNGKDKWIGVQGMNRVLNTTTQEIKVPEELIYKYKQGKQMFTNKFLAYIKDLRETVKIINKIIDNFDHYQV